MNCIKYIFFDMGTTLVDETQCYYHRIRDAISGTDVTFEQFLDKLISFQKQNMRGDLEALNFFGLEKTPWHTEDECLYPDTKDVLEYLRDKGYELGIIANQSAGSADRLQKWGILPFFDVICASAEEGVAKPDSEIFLRAMQKAGCKPENAVMVGDRLDNDIYPAKKLGMKTVWAKQGFCVYCTPESPEYEADFTINTLSELKSIF